MKITFEVASFGQYLRMCLASAGMTPTDLPRRLGVSRATTHNWVRDDKFPRRTTLPKIVVAVPGMNDEWAVSFFFMDSVPPGRRK